jgi:hypothetical protein
MRTFHCALLQFLFQINKLCGPRKTFSFSFHIFHSHFPFSVSIFKHSATGNRPPWRGRENDSSTHVHCTGMYLCGNRFRYTCCVYTVHSDQRRNRVNLTHFAKLRVRSNVNYSTDRLCRKQLPWKERSACPSVLFQNVTIHENSRPEPPGRRLSLLAPTRSFPAKIYTSATRQAAGNTNT